METYIITFEDGNHYKTSKITENEIDGVYNGILTIIRLSDQKEMNQDGDWEDLKEWENVNAAVEQLIQS